MKKVIIWVAIFLVTLSSLLLPLQTQAAAWQPNDIPQLQDYYEIVYLDYVTPESNYYISWMDFVSMLENEEFDEKYQAFAYLNGLITDNVYDTAYQQGKDEGLFEGQMHEFKLKDLFFAIMDAPFAIIKNALGFEIFGINVSVTIIGILSIALVIFVIKRLLLWWQLLMI